MIKVRSARSAVASNDNRLPRALRRPGRERARHAGAAHLTALLALGIRGVAKPETLTRGEIQEIAWGLLVAAGTPDETRVP